MLQPYTKEWLEELVKDSYSYAEVLRKAGRKPSGGNNSHLKHKIEEYQIDTLHFKGRGWSRGLTKETDARITSNRKYSIEELFIENNTVARSVVRRYIIDLSLLPYICIECGNNGTWRDKIIALELEHKNGVNNDDRLENLCFLCPNCHAATETYGGKNNRTSEEKNPRTKICQCGKSIFPSSQLCADCNKLNSRIVDRPSREELKFLIRTIPFTTLGKQFGVSDNAIRKWCDMYNLPRKSSEIKKYTNDEWMNI